MILKGFVKGATAAPSGAIAGAAVISQMDADHYGSVAKIATASGARTSLFVTDLHRMFVAVPHRGSQEPAIRVYEAVK